jgi:hypothetical protein
MAIQKLVQEHIKDEKKGKESDFKTLTILDDSAFEDVRLLAQKKAEFSKLEKEVETLSNSVKKSAYNEFTNEYHSKKGNPGTVVIMFKNKKGEEASLKFSPQDKYKVLKNKEAIELREQFGSDVIKATNQYIIDEDMYNRYHKEINKWLRTSPDIADDDRDMLIRKEVKLGVAPGTVNRLHQIALRLKKTVGDIMDKIGCIFSISEVKTLKENKQKVVRPTAQSAKNRTTA